MFLDIPSCTNIIIIGMPLSCIGHIHRQTMYAQFEVCCVLTWFHYNDVIMSTVASQIISLTIVIQAWVKENIKAPRHWPLCGEFTGEFSTQRASNGEMLQFDDVIMLIMGNITLYPSESHHWHVPNHSAGLAIRKLRYRTPLGTLNVSTQKQSTIEPCAY